MPMNNTPQLSVIVPVLNEADGIVPFLLSLQVLRERGVEILLVDGGSTDGTPVLARSFADRILTAPLGRARQMNAGATLAQGRLLLFLHADTRLPADADRLIFAALDGAPGSPVWGRFDVHIEGRSPWLKLIARMMNLRSRLTGIATGDQAIFVRHNAFSMVGGYPEQPLMEDIELSSRLKKLGPPACLRERVITSGRRWEAHGVWRTILLMWRLRFDYWRGVSPVQLARRYRPQSSLQKGAGAQ